MPARPFVLGIGGALLAIVAIALAFMLLVPHELKSAEPAAVETTGRIEVGERIPLPSPRTVSETSVEEALAQRRSVRDYSEANLSLRDVSQLLWAAQGITAPWGGRTAPSAGALYPLELYVAVGAVDGLDTGVYRYRPEKHELEKVKAGDARAALAAAAFGQECVEDAAIDLVVAGVYERTTERYGDRGIQYVHMEAGHAAQNVYLQAEALKLGTVVIGAFRDSEVARVMGLQEQSTPLYIMPVGRKG
jgi:SagB-type dehydrogenase family enzyme